MSQAITTHFLCPTDTKGTRVKAVEETKPAEAAVKTREDYEAAGFVDMARDRSYYLSTCPHADGTWQRDAWQAGAWRWMQSQRGPRCA